MPSDRGKTKAQLIAEMEEMRQQLSEHTEQAQRERAVERVRAEAMAMRSTDDLVKVVAVLHQGMVRQGIETLATGIQFLDDSTDNLQLYYAFENPRKHGISWSARELVEFDCDTAVVSVENPSGPWWEEWKRDWETHRQTGQSWSMTVDGTAMEEDWRADCERYGFDGPFPIQIAEKCVLTNVPFEYGTVGYNEPFFLEEHASVVRELTEVLSLGYLRFLDFQRLQEKNQALEEANQQIQENTRRKSDFLARMSHDLRTPMNAIIGYTHILLRRLGDTIEPRQLRNLENIDTSAHNLLN